MKSIVIEASNPTLLAEQIVESSQSGFKPTLGLVFCDNAHDKNAIAAFFEEHSIQLIGCSTAGEIAMVDSYNKHIVAMLMDMNEEDFVIDHREYISTTKEDLLMQQAAESAMKSFDNPSLLLFSCGVTRDHEKIVTGISAYLPKDTPVYGGVAGGDSNFTESVCFSSKGIINEGIVTLVVNGDKIKLEGLAVSGWQGMGNINVVTKAKGNVLLEINNEPALDFFCKHFGFDGYYDYANDERLSMPGNYPLEMVNKNGYQRLRSIMNFDVENKALILAAGVKEGDTFRFCLPPSLEVLDNSVSQFQKMADMGVKADAVVLISCMARKVVFGPLIDHEVKGIQEIWNKPLIGFFSFGEIGRISDKDMCDLHNCTSNLLTITEAN